MNSIYNLARRSMLTNQFDWATLNLVLYVFAGEPVFEPADASMADVVLHTPGAIDTSLPVLGQAVTIEGVAQTGPIVVPDVPIGPDITFMVLAISTGVFGTSKPILFIDDAMGLPFVPNGLDMVVQPDWALGRGWFRP